MVGHHAGRRRDATIAAVDRRSIARDRGNDPLGGNLADTRVSVIGDVDVAVTVHGDVSGLIEPRLSSRSTIAERATASGNGHDGRRCRRRGLGQHRQQTCQHQPLQAASPSRTRRRDPSMHEILPASLQIPGTPVFRELSAGTRGGVHLYVGRWPPVVALDETQGFHGAFAPVGFG